MTMLPGILVANKVWTLINSVRDRKYCNFSREDMITITGRSRNGL